VSRPGTLAWFARHELRLAWRDWLSMVTAGGRTRLRTVAIALLVFAAVIALVLAATGVFVYLQFEHEANTALDSGLRSRADELSAAVRQSGSRSVHNRHLVGKTDSFAEVLDAEGKVLDSSLTIGDTDLLDPGQLERAATEEVFVDSGSLPGSDGGVRLLATPVEAPNGTEIVVVGTSTQDTNETRTDLEQLLLVALPVALILASIAGYFLAAAALRPVEAMRARAEEISTASAEERLPVPDTRDEVARLGNTLNEMLARIGDAMERERAFVADASHELRTPLTAIRGFAEYYRQRGGMETRWDRDEAPATGDGLTPSDLDRLMQRVEKEAARMGLLVEDLLLLARLDQQRPIEHRPVDLLVLAADAVQDTTMIAPGRPVHLDVEPGQAFLIDGDEARLRQVIGNLMSNALTHTPGGSPITVAVSNGTRPR